MAIAAYRKEVYFRARLGSLRETPGSDDPASPAVSTGAVTGTVDAAGTSIAYTNAPYTSRDQAQQAWSRWNRGRLPGSSSSLSLSGELLDDTNFFSQGWMSRVVGLRDWSITGSAFYQEESGAAVNPTSVIRQAWARRQPVQIVYLPDGLNGFYGLCEIETLDLSGDVNGLETFDFTFQANGPLYSFYNTTGDWPDFEAIDDTATTTVAGRVHTNVLRAHVETNSGGGDLPPFYDPNFDAPAN